MRIAVYKHPQMSRIYNFSAGPATIPEAVLAEAQEHLLNYHGAGFSIMEASHRGPQYDAVHTEATANIKELMGLGDTHEVLFMTGGATSQFSIIPMNLLGEGKTADYTLDGSWAKKAVAAGKKVGSINVAADVREDRPLRLPRIDELQLTDNAAYLHVTSNETIEGIQWKEFPKHDTLVSDMSSDILSRKLDFSSFGLIYAGAQKNLGPSGVTLVIVRKDLLEAADDSIPEIMKYSVQASKNSLFNTPPTFSIYMLALTTRWMKEQGGVEAIQVVNERKAKTLYDQIDSSDYWTGSAAVENRSDMNVTFRLPSEDLEAQFLKEAGENGMSALKGHRSVGGIRASIYNAMPEAGVETLVSFMKAFEAANG